MNDRIRDLLSQISILEEELVSVLHSQEHRMFFQLKGKRVEFEHTIKLAHRKLKTGFFRWVVTNRPQNLITGPVIYSMVVPLILLDLCVSFYQAVCFPIYGIKKVRRGNYIVFDRQHLEYLNWIEKSHCTYCAYGTGVLAYVSEIVGRTEEYFCPIKHAHKMLGTHSRYARFLDYGDPVEYSKRVEEFRKQLGK